MIYFCKHQTGILFISLLLLLGCSGKTNTTDQPIEEGKDRQALLTHWADNIIIPTYSGFKVNLDAMIAKSAAFSAKPDLTTLAEFRMAWVDTYTEWQKVELFDVGPGSKRALRSYINIYPANVAGIEENIATPTSNLEITSSFDRQGFPALDYLLNGTGKSDAEIVDYFKLLTNGTKRLDNIKRITDHISLLINGVIADWNGSYRAEFISKTGVDIGSPMGEPVNAYVLHYERFIHSGKFGIPSWAMLNGVVAADKVEGFYK